MPHPEFVNAVLRNKVVTGRAWQTLLTMLAPYLGQGFIASFIARSCDLGMADVTSHVNRCRITQAPRVSK
jgi:hypothetical protein